ncbi:MAG: pyridoxamine 5'-phosphate oxidase [Rhizobiaceae bacterium]
MKNFTKRKDPLVLFNEWLSEAEKSEPNDPNAMTVATVDGDGMPNARVLLLKGHDERGFVFYTNYESTKGQELEASGKTCLAFHWKSLRRQIRIRGNVEIVSDQEADIYYNTRHPQSRLGAWASNQSRPLDERQILIDRLAEYEAQYGTENIPRPPHWKGMRVIPDEFEFWQDGEFRLHDRVKFIREGEGWTGQRLYP